MRVREKDDLGQWFRFFLVGMIETAKSGVATFDEILRLQRDVDERLRDLGARAANAQKVVRYLYQQALINAETVSKVTEISMPSSYKLIHDLERLDILKEITGGRRDRLYLFEDYLRIYQS
jgi:Fic family protein